jgi:hypothetical protein
MAFPLLCSGMAHPLTSALPVPRKRMRDLLLGGLGIPRLGPGAGSALQLVRGLAADAFVNVVAHRFRLRVVAQHCAATLPSRRAAGVQASGGFSGAEKATPSSRSLRETVSVFLGGSRLMRAEGSALSLQRKDASRRLASPFVRDVGRTYRSRALSARLP